jgi:cell division inhibitor SulA
LSCLNTVYLYSYFAVVLIAISFNSTTSESVIRAIGNNVKQGYIMDYLLEDIFRRADTWRGMGQSHTAFLSANALSANNETQSLQGVETGFATLDAQLYNRGWPLGGSIEVISEQCGLDAMGIFMPIMKKLSGQGRWQVFIDPPYTPYAPLLAGEGVDLQEIMLVHPRDREELLWSTEQALRSTTCGVVFAWLGATDYRYAELRKIQLAAASHGSLAVLFRSTEVLSQASPASLRIQLEGYRQLKIIKQRGGCQSSTIPLPFDDSLHLNSPVWSLPDQPPSHRSRPELRPSA